MPNQGEVLGNMPREGLEERLKKNAERIREHGREVIRRRENRRDFVVPRSKLGVLSEDGLKLQVDLPEGPRHFPLLNRSLRQLVAKTDVPYAYLASLEERGHPDLAAANLSEILSREASGPKGPIKHLVRVLDDQVDGVLSDSYKAVSNDTVLALCAEEFARADVKIWDLSLTDTSFRVQGVAGHLIGKITEERKFRGRWDGRKGDTANAGITIENSENGHRKASASSSIWLAWCENFNVWGDTVARVHLGGKLDEGEHFFSDETKALEAAAFLSKIKDTIRNTFDPVKFKAIIDAINATTQREIGDSPAKVVDAAVKAWGLSVERRDAILEELLSSGDKSQYGVSNALTALANPSNAGRLKVSDAEKNLLQDAGGAILRLTEARWKSFLAGAYAPKRGEEVEEKPVQTVRVVTT